MPAKDKEKQREASRKHYRKNKPAMIARAAKFKTKAIARNRNHTKDYLKEHPCVDCGNKDVRVLEFDHVRGTKKASISLMIQQGLGLATIDKEILKCDIRCCNCHRIKTGITLWGWSEQ